MNMIGSVCKSVSDKLELFDSERKMELNILPLKVFTLNKKPPTTD